VVGAERPAAPVEVRAVAIPPAQLPGSVRVRSRFRLDHRSNLAPLVEPPMVARHPTMARLYRLDACQYEPSGCVYLLDYHAARASTDVEAAAPAHVRIEQRRLGDTGGGGRHTVRTALVSPRRRFAPGGPQVGAGLALRDEARLRWRAGWEMFAPGWLAHGLHVEGDARGVEAALVPSWEAMTPGFFRVLPSVGAGVGIPVAVAPRLEVGARLQLSMHWRWIGTLFTLDVFPGRRSWHPAVWGQFSL
jgi:hypothetical protein